MWLKNKGWVVSNWEPSIRILSRDGQPVSQVQQCYKHNIELTLSCAWHINNILKMLVIPLQGLIESPLAGRMEPGLLWLAALRRGLESASIKSERVLLVPVQQWQSLEQFFFQGKSGFPLPMRQKGLLQLEIISFLNFTSRNYQCCYCFPLLLSLLFYFPGLLFI